MNYIHIQKIETFINAFLIGKTGVQLYSVKILGGNDSGKAEIVFVKNYGITGSPIHFAEIFNYRT